MSDALLAGSTYFGFSASSRTNGMVPILFYYIILTYIILNIILYYTLIIFFGFGALSRTKGMVRAGGRVGRQGPHG